MILAPDTNGKKPKELAQNFVTKDDVQKILMKGFW